MNIQPIGGAAYTGNGGVTFSGATPVQRFMTGVHLWMTAALVISAFASILTIGGFAALDPSLSQREAIALAMRTPIGALVFGNSIGYIVLIVAELALVFFLAARISKMSPTAAIITFFVYATLNGITISSIFLVYSLPSIAMAFFICAGMFAGMSVFGLITKKDLTKVGSVCIMAIWGIIIASLVNFFLKSSGLSWIISLVSVVLFSALTAYDNQKLKYMCYEAPEGSEAYAKYSIMGALTLYLDFINLFLALVRIFGRQRD